MEFDTIRGLLQRRYSVRGFFSDPVPKADIRNIFEAAKLSPSNCNTQPWQVYVASGDSIERLRVELVAEASAGKPPQADFAYFDQFPAPYRQRQVECAMALYQNMGIARNDREARSKAMLRNFAFFDAPHVAFICMPKDFDTVNAVDIGIYLQSLMLLMESKGISCCAQGALGFYPGPIKTILDIPEHLGVVVGLSFGYADPSNPANNTRTERAQMQQSVTFFD